MDSIEQQKEHFNKIAENYYSTRQNSNSSLYRKYLWDYIFRNAPPPPREILTLLEPMCGYAEGKEIIEAHYSKKTEYTGFDYSEEIINIVKKIAPERNVFVQDATTYHPTSKFDCILIIGGLHHVPDYTEVVLRNLRAGLADDGYFVNWEPTHGNRIAKAIRDRTYRKNPVFDYETERDYSVNELNKMYKDAGYDIVQQFYPGLLTYCLYANPDVFPFLAKIPQIVLKIAFKMEKCLYKTRLAKCLSFLTITILKKK